MVDEVMDDTQAIESQSTPAQANEQPERMFTQRDMSEVVRREREKALEKGKREALAEIERQKSMGFQANPLAQNNQMTQEQIEQIIAQKAPEMLQKQLQELEHNARTKHVVESFANKIEASKERFPELESQLNDLDFHTFAPIVTLANDMENTSEIMHDLMQNPMKMGNLLSLLRDQPKMAAKAMYELSNSIKQNQQAAQENRSAREPFNQLKPSVTKGIDNSNMSVTDFRKMFKG